MLDLKWCIRIRKCACDLGQCIFSPSDIWFYGTKEKRTITSIQMIFLPI